MEALMDSNTSTTLMVWGFHDSVNIDGILWVVVPT